jgi:hypothetical protein
MVGGLDWDFGGVGYKYVMLASTRIDAVSNAMPIKYMVLKSRAVQRQVLYMWCMWESDLQPSSLDSCRGANGVVIA